MDLMTPPRPVAGFALGSATAGTVVSDEELEDLVIAQRVTERLADDDGTRLTFEELVAGCGFSRDEVAEAAEELATELGLS
jgi:hypothetical protein